MSTGPDAPAKSTEGSPPPPSGHPVAGAPPAPRIATGLPEWDLLPPATILRRPGVGR